MHTLCTSQVKTNTKPPPFFLKLPLLPWSIWENGMHCVVLTATCCICAFRSDTSDLSKWTLSYTIFSWTPNSMQKKIKNLFFFLNGYINDLMPRHGCRVRYHTISTLSTLLTSYMSSGLNEWIRAHKARPLRQELVKSTTWTSRYFPVLSTLWHHRSRL